MSSQMLDRTSTAWYDLVVQQLDVLRNECQCLEDRSAVPPDSLFEAAKRTVENLRQVTNFPILPEADIWPGPNGEIGITWEFSGQFLELLFAEKITARVFNEKFQAGLEMKQVPMAFVNLIEQQAA